MGEPKQLLAHQARHVDGERVVRTFTMRDRVAELLGVLLLSVCVCENNQEALIYCSYYAAKIRCFIYVSGGHLCRPF